MLDLVLPSERLHASGRRDEHVALRTGASLVFCGMCALLAVSMLSSGSAPKPTELGMAVDVHKLQYVHAAYIHGSVPTAAQEADDIITGNFPDEHEKAPDSPDNMPGAYVRGSVVTAPQEATDITGVKMDKARTESLKAMARLSKLVGDGHTLKGVHAAYIQGSVPTSAQEADDIITNEYPDEQGKNHSAPDSIEHQPAAYIRGSVATSAEEASNITGVAKDEQIRRLKARVAVLEAQLAREQQRAQLSSLRGGKGAVVEQLASRQSLAALAPVSAPLDETRSESPQQRAMEQKSLQLQSAREEAALDQDLKTYQSQFLIKGI